MIKDMYTNEQIALMQAVKILYGENRTNYFSIVEVSRVADQLYTYLESKTKVHAETT